MATGTIEPRRLALRYAPPGIIVEYAAQNSSSSSSSASRRPQLFHHEIDLQDVLHSQSPRDNERVDIDAIVAKLVAAHDRVLGGRKVSTRQLTRLVQKLIDQTSPQHEEEGEPERAAAAPTVSAGATAAVLPQADYNRVSEMQLRQVKMKMDLVFQQNFVRPGEDGYQYDKQVAFSPTQEASDWDDE